MLASCSLNFPLTGGHMRTLKTVSVFWCVLAVGLWAGGSAPEAAPTPSRNLSTYVLLGLDTIMMKEFVFTNVGNIGTNNAAGTLRWGRKSFFNDGSEIVTDVLARAGDHSSLWDLFANTTPLALAQSTIRHQGPITWTAPPLISPLPLLPSCVPGASPVVIPKGGSMTLGPGNYGAVVVANGATLTLTGGTYCFSDFKTGRKATVVVAGVSEIDVVKRFRVGDGSVVRPDTGLGATDIAVNVAGKQVKFGRKSKAFGIYFAPNALMRFGRSGSCTGQFIAKDMRSDFGGIFTLQVCGNGIVDPGESCD